MRKKQRRQHHEDIWIPTLCESQCADAPCLLKVHRVDGVAVGVEPNRDLYDYEHQVKNQGRLCPKSYGVIQKIYNPHRIKGPLRRTNPEKGRGIDPGWKEISWDEALDVIAEKLRKIRADDPRRLAEGGGIGAMRQAGWRPFFEAFGPAQSLIGGRSTRCDQNEHAFANRIHGGFQCEPDIERCRYLILIGSNSSASGGTPEGVLFSDARERGMKLVVVDPVFSVTAAKADEWIPIRPCTDLAFLLAMIHVLIHELETYDEGSLKEITNSPYLVGPDGYFMRDKELEKALVWDPVDGKAKTYDDETIQDLALLGFYEVAGATCRTAFQALKDQVSEYTPEWAADITDIPAETIRRISKEWVEYAAIGSTIELDGITYPHRPVATKLGRGVTGVMRSYPVVLANHILAALVGSIEVPGGHMGGSTFSKGRRNGHIFWKQYGLDSGIIPGKDGMRDVHNYPFIWPPISYGAIETLCPMSDYYHAPPPFNDPGEFHFQMDHLNWRNLADPPKNLPIPPPPEMWIRYRTNPLLALGDPSYVIKVLKQIPFIVSISYVMDEVTEYADLVLPEEVEFERYMPYFNIRNACHKKYFMLALGQPVVRAANVMNINDILMELADRAGFVDEMNAVFSRKLGFTDEYRLDKGRKYTWEEISDRMCRFYTDGTHDLEWFKKHGALTRPARAKEQYDIYLAMKEQNVRYPIPYMEKVKQTGEELAKNLKEKGIDWWRTDEYVALPSYFPSKLEEVPPEYDFYVTTCRPIMFSYGSNLGLPWMNELALEQLPDQVHIVMNTRSAEAKGIRDGDKICVESEVSKVVGKVTLRQGIRPDTLLIAGQFGQWAMPVARDTGRVTLSSLIPIDPKWTDPVVGVQQGFVTKVKVYRA